jgi:uncharacterized radical SAM superfamily Fe-S cluster-containing enzyme
MTASRTLLKRTRSLSPLTFEEVDAEVVLEDGRVFLEKRDENGTFYKTLLENDYSFYRQMTRDRVEEQVSPHAIDLYVSHKCNLACPVCYEDIGGKKALSVAEVERLLSGYENKVIGLMGREPTCNPEIFDVIRIASRRNRACLITNGVNLADRDYVMRLKEAGVDSITFSFNGFDDEIYRRMNGKPLLEVKLRALENLKQAGIPTCLSATLARGVNEDQVRPLADYCFDNRSFIFELRIRTTEPVGRSLDVQPYCMSELVSLVTDSLGIEREDVLKEYLFWQQVLEETRLPVPENVRKFTRTRLCSFNFHVRKKQCYSAVGSYIDVEAIRRAAIKEPLIAYYFLKAYGIRTISKNLSVLFKTPSLWKETDGMMIVLRVWPNIYNIDLEENRKCPTQYYKNGVFLPFCYANATEHEQTEGGVQP